MSPLEWWKTEHGKAAPVGYVLRGRYPENWVRFHSLPESKRYPDFDWEMAEIIRRAITIAGALFDEGEVVYIYKSRFYFDDDPPAPDVEKLAGQATEQGCATFFANPDDLPPNEDDAFTTWALSAAWPPSFFSELIRQVANEEERLLSFVSPMSGNIFSPYDGGFDLFFQSTDIRRSLKFLKGWRSSRHDGL